MEAKDLPGELESDLMILGTRAEMLVRSSVKLGEMKARIELFQLIREAMADKYAQGDEIAGAILEWLWLELSEKYQINLSE
jgi:hypothetical protein